MWRICLIEGKGILIFQCKYKNIKIYRKHNYEYVLIIEDL